ncbi:MAG: hypothetical protein NC090_03130 [Anaeroplasma bactoclasticum]|nr:hypothetical protein [Anaeroplasma bactoclasticum]
MKRKTLTLTLVLLSCLALIGVGFASWIISANTTKEVEGNISVDTVTDNRLTVETAWKDDKNSVVFGWKSGTYANNWLKNTDVNYAENLEVTLVVTLKDVEGHAKDAATNGVTATISGDTLYDTAKGANLVGELPTASVTKVEGETGVYHVTFTFTWGSAFNGKNPLEYYNSQSYTDELAAQAQNNLNALNALKDSKFTVTLTVTPAE